MAGRSHLPNSPTVVVPIGTRGSARAEEVPQEEGHKGLGPHSRLSDGCPSPASAFGHLTFRSVCWWRWMGWLVWGRGVPAPREAGAGPLGARRLRRGV